MVKIKRKVNLVGQNTLTVSLPAKWVEKTGIKKGDEIELIEHADSLFLRKGEIKAPFSTVEIDISGLDRTSILILIQSLYFYGYDEIKIHANSISVPHYRVRLQKNVSDIIYEAVNRLIGSEIISSTPENFVIKYITKESEEDLDLIIRRIFRLLSEMISSFIDVCEKKEMLLLNNIELHHSNLKKFINYALRLLNKYGHPSARKTSFYFSIITSLSKIEDLIKNASRTIQCYKFDIENESIEFVRKLQKSISMYYDFFYKFKYKKMAELSAKRDTFKQEFFSKLAKMSKQNIALVAGLAQILEIILDMTEMRASLEN